MAVGTASVLMGGAALAGSAFQFAKGRKQEKEAQKALNEFERQELTNIYNDMPISLMGSNIRREDADQAMANSTQAAQGAGIRGVFGALPKIQAIDNRASRENQLDVDNQVMKREYSRAGDEGRIQQMQEARDNADLAGIGQQLAVGQQNTMSGITGAFNGLGLIGSGFEGTIGGDGEDGDAGGNSGTWTPPAIQLGKIQRPDMYKNNVMGSRTPGVQADPNSFDMNEYFEFEKSRRMRNALFSDFQ